MEIFVGSKLVPIDCFTSDANNFFLSFVPFVMMHARRWWFLNLNKEQFIFC